MRQRVLLAAGLLLALLVAIIGIAILALAAGACPGGGASGTADAASSTARRAIPSNLLPIYEQVGAQYDIPWEVLAGIGTEECGQAQTSDPSCTLQPGATGPGAANYAGASGLMQIGIGGGAGDEYDALRHYLPHPSLGPHDPLTSVQLAALVLIKDKGAPTGQPIDSYRDYVRAYNGSGPAADAYASRVIADAHTYQGSGTSSFVSYGGGCTNQFVGATGYVNPFAHAQVNASRIDQGVDYGGSGPIDALGPGRVVMVSSTDTGWATATAGSHTNSQSGNTLARTCTWRKGSRRQFRPDRWSAPASRSGRSTDTRSKSDSPTTAPRTPRSPTASTPRARIPRPAAP